MKKFILSFITIFSLSAFAQPVQVSGFGVGILIGDPTAFSFKGHLGNDHYFDVALAYNTGEADGIYTHGSYIIENQGVFQIEEELLNLYYGVGGRLFVADTKKHDDEVHLGLRVPVGINYYLKDPSVEFFGEISANMNLTPETEFDLDVSLGARYWF